MGLKTNTPELTFLLAKWGSKVPYRRVAELLGELLGEFLSISGARVSYTTVRRHTLAVGEHLDQRSTIGKMTAIGGRLLGDLSTS
jgi:hypothetical protein